jgi:hypothetical protein
MQPETEPDVFGKRMLVGMIGFVGLCILGFGVLQLVNRQYMTGSIIVFIALFDFAILTVLVKKL